MTFKTRLRMCICRYIHESQTNLRPIYLCQRFSFCVCNNSLKLKSSIYVPRYIFPSAWLHPRHKPLKDVGHKFVTLLYCHVLGFRANRSRRARPTGVNLDGDIGEVAHGLNAHLVSIAASPLEHRQLGCA